MTEMKILDMPVKAKWYEMQESGEKDEEYRDITPYWEKRLLDYKRLKKYVSDNYKELMIKKFIFPYRPPIENVTEAFSRGYTHIRLRYGYTKRTFLHKIDYIAFGMGKPEWGAPKDRQVFIIKHHKEPADTEHGARNMSEGA